MVVKAEYNNWRNNW